MGLLPGEVFVHRNIANLVQHSDLNCLSVLQFAVEVIGISHIIICGHYGCSGIDAAVHGRKVGLADNWLRSAQDAFSRKKSIMDKMNDRERWNYACEQNVVEQVRNVALTTVLQDAWERGQDVSIHGWVYGINDGLVRELVTDVNSNATLAEKYAAAS
jgi:carbonic anhydrase